MCAVEDVGILTRWPGRNAALHAGACGQPAATVEMQVEAMGSVRVRDFANRYLVHVGEVRLVLGLSCMMQRRASFDLLR